MHQTSEPAFDPTWEDEIYSQGRHLNRYPFDVVVSFVCRHCSRNKPRSEVGILEVGCGAGNNLWFAAREGFTVTGIDASASAIEYARKRFVEEGLKGDFYVGDFTRLMFDDGLFDLAIDRAAITHCGLSAAKKAIAEVNRVLKVGGRFFLNTYSNKHSSYMAGRSGLDGLTRDISAGTLAGVGQVCFYGRRELGVLFEEGWRLLSIQHLELVEEIETNKTIHAEWRAIAEKVEK